MTQISTCTRACPLHGQAVTYSVFTSEPKGRSWPRELWFSIYSCVIQSSTHIHKTGVDVVIVACVVVRVELHSGILATAINQDTCT